MIRRLWARFVAHWKRSMDLTQESQSDFDARQW